MKRETKLRNTEINKRAVNVGIVGMKDSYDAGERDRQIVNKRTDTKTDRYNDVLTRNEYNTCIIQ